MRAFKSLYLTFGVTHRARPALIWEMVFRQREWLELSKRPALRSDFTAEEMRYSRNLARDTAGLPRGSDICLWHLAEVGIRERPLCASEADIPEEPDIPSDAGTIFIHRHQASFSDNGVSARTQRRPARILRFVQD